jgi:hypothetical protein
MRLYDFQRNYTDYISYVNLLCQIGAMYLGLNTEDDVITVGGVTYPFQRFKWEYYRFTDDATKSVAKKFTAAASSSISKLKSNAKKVKSLSDVGDFFFNTIKDIAVDENVENLYTNYNYVQFYVDPESGQSESINNSTSESQLFGSLLNQGQSITKELAFILNSGGAGNAAKLQKNIGEIAGFATEIEDIAPEGFKLVEDGTWTLDGERAVTTSLKDKELQPGESTTLNVTFEWQLTEDTIGLKSNEAHIAKYENEYDAKDVTEDNKGKQDLMVTVKTGSNEIAIVTAGFIYLVAAAGAVGIAVRRRK